MFFYTTIEFGTLPKKIVHSDNPATYEMKSVTKFEGLGIEDAKTALAYAMTVLDKQTVPIYTAIIVQTHRGDTSGHKDLFSICVFSERKRIKQGVIVLKVTTFTEKAENPKEKLAVIGDLGQWIVKDIA